MSVAHRAISSNANRCFDLRFNSCFESPDRRIRVILSDFAKDLASTVKARSFAEYGSGLQCLSDWQWVEITIPDSATSLHPGLTSFQSLEARARFAELPRADQRERGKGLMQHVGQGDADGQGVVLLCHLVDSARRLKLSSLYQQRTSSGSSSLSGWARPSTKNPRAWLLHASNAICVRVSQARDSGSLALTHPFQGGSIIRARLKLLLTTVNPRWSGFLAYCVRLIDPRDRPIAPPEALIRPARTCSFRQSTNSSTGTFGLSRCIM